MYTYIPVCVYIYMCVAICSASELLHEYIQGRLVRQWDNFQLKIVFVGIKHHIDQTPWHHMTSNLLSMYTEQLYVALTCQLNGYYIWQLYLCKPY